MTSPTQPSGAEKMREACARVAESYEEPNRFKVSDTWRDDMTPSSVYETGSIDAAGWIAEEIRALPLPPDPRTEQIAALVEAAEALRRIADGAIEPDMIARAALTRIDAISKGEI